MAGAEGGTESGLNNIVLHNQVDALKQGLQANSWQKKELIDGLFSAASHRKWPCLDALLEHGIPVNRCNRKGQTVLHKVITSCVSNPDMTLTVLKKILDIAESIQKVNMDVFLNKKCNMSDGLAGFTVLHQAVAAKHVKCVTSLLQHGAKPNIRSGFYMRSPLMEAASKGSLELVELLLDHGANPNLLDKGGQTVLIYAAQCGKVACLQRLIEVDCNVNIQNHTGNSALMQAAWNGHTDCIQILLEAGADVYQTDFLGRSVLRYAVKSRKKDLLELILNVTDAMPNDLSIGKAVVELDDVQMLRTLLSRGMSVKSETSGDSVLHTAAEMGSMKCLEFLLEAKGQLELDINAINDAYGVSPLQRACAYGYHEIVDLLLTHGADPNLPSREGLTPLFYSCEVLQLALTKARGLECIKALLRFGCEVDHQVPIRCRGSRNKYSMTHLSYSLISCNLYMARMLVAAGAHSFEATFSNRHIPAEIYPRELLSATEQRDSFIRNELYNPSSLFVLSRTAVRNAIHTDISNKVSKLPIPPHIQENLKLCELDEIIETYATKLESQDDLGLEEEFEDSISYEESDVDMAGFSSTDESSDDGEYEYALGSAEFQMSDDSN